MTGPAPGAAASGEGAGRDPVRERRARYGHRARAGKRAGYSLFALAIVAFTVGAVGDFTPTIVRVVVASMAVGSVILAPSIVIAYGVSAADRDERRAAAGSEPPFEQGGGEG